MSNMQTSVLNKSSNDLLHAVETKPVNSVSKDIQKDRDEFSMIDPHIIELLQNKYKVIRLIGSGAQGDIYEGQCLKTGNRVAIKQLRIDSVKNWKQYDLFAREAQVLESLNIPGTAKFYEAIQSLESEHPMSVIVQEYIDGRSLQSYLNNGERFSFEQCCGILKNLVEILKNLHTHDPQVIHRDIKPSNILLRFDNSEHAVIPEVFLIDFGAVANPQVQTGGSTVTGTYGYMAPEQLVGSPTPASDIYAFAMLAVYMFSGVPPEKIETKELRVLIEPHLEHLPYVVTVFLRKMLETSPNNRLMDYHLIIQTLERFGQQNFDVNIQDNNIVSVTQKYKLKNVNSLGQAGNITLWQTLPENCPRNIPREYLKKFIMFKQENSDKIFISDRGYYIDENIDKSLKTIRLVLAVSFSSLLLIALLGVCQLGMGTYTPAFLIFSFFLIAFIIIPILENSNIKLYHCLNNNILLLKQTRHVFSQGRKTLATVKSVQLLPLESTAYRILKSSELKEAQTEKDFGKLSKKLNKKIKPVWEVVYAFNPPDDNNPNPLFHRYYSTKPVDDVVRGDVLPILYFHDTVKDVVYSMPYPLPVDDALTQCPNLVSADNIHVDGTRY